MPRATTFFTKTGISLAFSGTNGTDWMEEYFFHDDNVARKAIYLRSSTTITASHNARNQAATTTNRYVDIGANGLDGTPASGDEGKIRYRIDGDAHWGPHWTTLDSSNVNPEFPGAGISFATMQYPAAQGSLSVLGRVGNNGVPIATKSSHFNYGIADSIGGEWHTITVADDDAFVASAPYSNTSDEWWTGDGRVYLFCVNPPFPVLQLTVSGNAQFYTTPAKTYFIPKIHDQKSIIHARSGTVNLELKSLTGEDVFYRINGGSWIQHANPTITHSSFSVGTNTLEYYMAGFTAFVKTRTVVRIADSESASEFPSYSEEHGYLLIGNDDNYAQILARRSQQPYVGYWNRYVSGQGDAGSRTLWDNYVGASEGYAKRKPPYDAFSNALVAKINGVAAIQSGKVKTYAAYAKEMILNNHRSVDMVGFEMQQPGFALPCRDYIYRGYFDVGWALDLVFAYDLLISIYKSTDASGGITPVEDYFLRDSIASDVFECLQHSNMTQGPQEYTVPGGMWDTARKCAAVIATLCMPSYSTPYYGTSGVDGNTTVYPDTPFRNYPLTWKEVYLDDDATIRSYPDLALPLGVEEYNCSPSGDFYDKTGYLQNMGNVFCVLLNCLKYRYPTKYLPNCEAFFFKCTSGTIIGLKDNSGPARFLCLDMFNSNFPAIADVGIPIVTSLPDNNVNSDNQLANGRMPALMGRYDVNYVPFSGTPATAPAFTTQPVSATRTEGESVTFTVVVTGNPTPTRQWRKDGANISGQTGTSYTIASTVVGDAGIYDCVATNSVAPSGVPSAQATLVVNAVPPPPDPVTKRTNYKTPAASLFAT